METTYTLRDLKADDVFPMFKLLSKIGIKEFKSCFESDEVKAAMAAMIDDGEVDKSKLSNLLGLGIFLDVADVILSHISDCKNEIYILLSGLSGMSKQEIADLSMITFTEMIVDVFKKPEFGDFYKVVSRLFK